MKKTLLFASLAISIISVGCSGSDAATKNTGPSEDPARAALDAKLKAMTPEERAKYVQEHPDEISSTYSGAKTPGQ